MRTSAPPDETPPSTAKPGTSVEQLLRAQRLRRESPEDSRLRAGRSSVGRLAKRVQDVSARWAWCGHRQRGYRRARRAPGPHPTRARHRRREPWGAAGRDALGLCGLDEDGRIALQVCVRRRRHRRRDRRARRRARPARGATSSTAARERGESSRAIGSMRSLPIGAGTRSAALLADDIQVEERRRGLRRESTDRATTIAEVRAIADLGVKTITSDVQSRSAANASSSVASASPVETCGPMPIDTECSGIAEIDNDGRIVAFIAVRPRRLRRRLSRNSTPGTSQAKRQPTRTHGRSSRGHLRRAQPARA